MNDTVEQIRSVLRDIWLHRRIGLAAAWLFVIIGAVAIYLMPDQYEASARVYVDTQSILKPLMVGLTVQPNLDQQVAMMSRTLISRPNIEKVAAMADLTLATKTPEQAESLYDSLMRKIQMHSTGGINLYTLSYLDPHPEVAKKVVQSLVSIFVESNLGDKRKDSDSAKQFLDEQIKAYEQKLDGAETALKNFKIANMDLMPETGKDYFSQMNEASTDLSQARLALSEAENGRDALKHQLAGDEPMLMGGGGDDSTQGSVPEIDTRIATLKQQLDELHLHYTDQYPDIIATKRIISDLENQKKAELKARGATAAGVKSTLSTNPVYQQISIQLAQADADVASLQTRVAAYEARYQHLRQATAAMPKIEQQFQELTRDYEVNKTNYEKLLARRESAQMSSDMDASTAMVEFRVIDPPRVSPKPAAPNRSLLMGVVIALALLGGAGVAFLVARLRPTVTDRKVLRDVTGLPVFGTVAMLWTAQQIAHRRRQLMAFITGAVALLGVCGASLAFFIISAARG